MAGTRPADRPASTVRWGREASTDHSHEDGERAVDAVLFTPQDPRTARHRRVPAVPRTIAAPGKPRNTSDRVRAENPVTISEQHLPGDRPQHRRPDQSQHDPPLWPS